MIEIDTLTWGPDNLLPVVSQDVATGTVLMQAWVNREALVQTIASGYATYWSRSRQQHWRKGETSGHWQRLHEIRTDCDADSLLFLVQQEGVACHEGSFSCFTKAIAPPTTAGTVTSADQNGASLAAILAGVETVLRQRKRDPESGSYTTALFEKGPDAYCKKIGEEAAEVILAVKNGDRLNLAWEVADLWFHSLVALVDGGIGIAEIAQQLKARQGKRRG